MDRRSPCAPRIPTCPGPKPGAHHPLHRGGRPVGFPTRCSRTAPPLGYRTRPSRGLARDLAPAGPGTHLEVGCVAVAPNGPEHFASPLVYRCAVWRQFDPTSGGLCGTRRRKQPETGPVVFSFAKGSARVLQRPLGCGRNKATQGTGRSGRRAGVNGVGLKARRTQEEGRLVIGGQGYPPRMSALLTRLVTEHLLTLRSASPPLPRPLPPPASFPRSSSFVRQPPFSPFQQKAGSEATAMTSFVSCKVPSVGAVHGPSVSRRPVAPCKGEFKFLRRQLGSRPAPISGCARHFAGFGSRSGGRAPPSILARQTRGDRIGRH